MRVIRAVVEKKGEGVRENQPCEAGRNVSWLENFAFAAAPKLLKEKETYS